MEGGEEESYEAMVVASFEAQDPAELSVDEFEVITVFTALAPEGWCLATKGGAEGLVPRDYVERLQPGHLLADFVAEDEAEVSCAAGEPVLVLPRLAPQGWVFVKRAADIGLVPADYVETGLAGAQSTLPRPQPARVISDFSPEDEAELAVAAGELVLMLDQPVHAEGWTTCTRLLDPTTPPGLVPTDYLELPHGEMTADFQAEMEGEVSIKRGERVWLAEQPVGTVRLASLPVSAM